LTWCRTGYGSTKPFLAYGDTRSQESGSPAPKIAFRRRDVVPKTSVFIISNNHHHVIPLWTLFQNEQPGWRYARHRIAHPHNRRVRLDCLEACRIRLFELARVDGVYEKQIRQSPPSLRCSRPLDRSRGHAGKIVKRLVMVLEVGDGRGVLPGQRGLPCPTIPSPGNALCGEQAADGLVRLGWQRGWLIGIGKSSISPIAGLFALGW